MKVKFTYFQVMIVIVFMLTISAMLQPVQAQTLKIPDRRIDAMGGAAFAKSISDSSLSLRERENIILREIKKGNIPGFLRKLTAVEQEVVLNSEQQHILFYVMPDYLAIGSDDDYFYVPTTPILAQKIARRFKCVMPTKKMVDLIYNLALIKIEPAPIPPSSAMTTVPVFIQHQLIVQEQLKPYITQHQQSCLTAGNKKDIIISNKIYTEKTPKVVIYGWHRLNGKAIQPVYNKHTNTWADYSHGLRLVQQKAWLNGRKTNIAKILASTQWHELLSDEGVIEKAYYPITDYR